jgi:hypothetical protein
VVLPVHATDGARVVSLSSCQYDQSSVSCAGPSEGVSQPEQTVHVLGVKVPAASRHIAT